MLDLDDFKLVNDSFGHVYGDRVLVHVAERIRSALRASDVTARYGGDEFALILPETDTMGGRQFVDRLRNALARHTFPDLGLGRAPAITAGVVAYPHSEVLRPEDLFTLAEAALARGKADAPDRVGVAESGGTHRGR
jgi:diguanylate cyclase (GGDEF)-like protein